MKVLKRTDQGNHNPEYITVALKRIRIQLENGDAFDLTEDIEGFLVVNKIDGSINVKPRFANEITIN